MLWHFPQGFQEGLNGQECYFQLENDDVLSGFVAVPSSHCDDSIALGHPSLFGRIREDDHVERW